MFPAKGIERAIHDTSMPPLSAVSGCSHAVQSSVVFSNNDMTDSASGGAIPIWSSVREDADRRCEDLKDQSVEVTENGVIQYLLERDQAAARWGANIPLDESEKARSYPTFVGGDSGLIIHRNNAKSLPHTDFTAFTKWGGLTTSIGAG